MTSIEYDTPMEPTLMDIAVPGLLLVGALKLVYFPPSVERGLLSTRSAQIRVSILFLVASLAMAIKVVVQ